MKELNLKELLEIHQEEDTITQTAKNIVINMIFPIQTQLEEK